MLEIRKPILSDAEGITSVFFKMFDMVEDDIDKDVLDKKRSKYDEYVDREKKAIKEGSCDKIIAVDDSEIIGIIVYGKSRDKELPYESEIKGIYVLQEFQGSGIGKKLMKSAVKELVRVGYKSMIIWAYEGNEYREYFAEIGGKPIEKKTRCIKDVEYLGIGYVYEDLEETLEKLVFEL